MKNKKLITYGAIIFIGLFVFILTWWINYCCDIESLDQILFHMKVPLNRMNNDIFIKFILYCVPVIIGLTVLGVFLIKLIDKKYHINHKIINLFLIFFVTSSVIYFGFRFNLYIFLYNQIVTSPFIEENYVDGYSKKITFPSKKRNLIYIYLESMENTYVLKKDGGNSDKVLIPNLTKLAKDNLNFSSNNLLGGAKQYDGTSWTMAGMVTSTSGIPIKVSLFSEALDGTFKNVLTLGEVLKENGYNQTLLIGSDASFGGRRAYFTKHGSYDIKDYLYMRDNNKIPDDYYVWWGYEDKKLVSFAKEELTRLSSLDKPFNFTMLTVDTHFVDGYLDPSCELKYDDQFSNVLYCSDKLISAFIKWIMNQPFYDNTTIVISGDHLTMDETYISQFDKDYDRTVYNTFINSAINTDNNKNRTFSTMDMFPTTLASLGVEIEGNRLGLGTNLFSSEKTLPELYQDFDKEISRTSNYYNNTFINK